MCILSCNLPSTRLDWRCHPECNWKLCRLYFLHSLRSQPDTHIQTSMGCKKFSLRTFLTYQICAARPSLSGSFIYVAGNQTASNQYFADFFLDAIKNATLLFGFHYPTWHSWLIGGWSIGIEFIFYLSFPAFLAAINTKPKQFAITAAFLTLLHFAWIHFTVTPSSFSPDGYNGNAALYHHPQAFSLYFFIGCFLGSQSTQTVFAQSSVIPLATILGGFGLLLAFTPDVKGHEITGWRGVIFPCVCIAMVYASGKINFCDKAKKLATILGATTYGLYLIHPIIYFTIAWHLIPQLSIQPQDVSFREKIDVIAFVLITSVALSIISDKAFEAPIRRRVKTWLTRKKQ